MLMPASREFRRSFDTKDMGDAFNGASAQDLPILTNVVIERPVEQGARYSAASQVNYSFGNRPTMLDSLRKQRIYPKRWSP
jgi:hypothetical protein